MHFSDSQMSRDMSQLSYISQHRPDDITLEDKGTGWMVVPWSVLCDVIVVYYSINESLINQHSTLCVFPLGLEMMEMAGL